MLERLLTAIKRTRFLLGRHRKQLPWIAALFVVNSILDTVGIAAVGIVAAWIFNPGEQNQHLLQYLEGYGGIATAAIALIAIFAVKNGLAITANRTVTRFAQRIRETLTVRALEAYLRAPHNLSRTESTSEIIYYIQTVTLQFSAGFIRSSLNLLSQLLVLAMISVLLARTNFVAFVVVAALFAVSGIAFDRFVRTRMRRLAKQLVSGNTSLIRTIHHSVGAGREIRVLGREAYFLDKTKSYADSLTKTNVARTMLSALPRYYFETLGVVCFAVWLIAIQRTGTPAEEAAFQFAVFGAAAVRMLPAASVMASSWTALRHDKHTVDILTRWFERLTPITEVAARELEPPNLANGGFRYLKARGISYRYAGAEQESLRDLGFEITLGEIVGIFGPSGAGKSTLVDVLTGLLEPSAGTIELNDSDANSVRRGRHMAYIPQGYYVLDDTVARNVALGVEDSRIDRGRVERSIEATGLSEVVRLLSDGIDTRLGESGVRLSGGERQRLVIARALYYRRALLVFDEPTSSLDAENIDRLFRTLESIRSNHASLIVSHDPRVLDRCDRLYEMSEGRLIEKPAAALTTEEAP